MTPKYIFYRGISLVLIKSNLCNIMSHYYPETQLLKYGDFESYDLSNVKFLNLFLLKALFQDLSQKRQRKRQWSIITTFKYAK